MDRIDIDPVRNRMRVVDYKFKFGGNPIGGRQQSFRACLRGERLAAAILFSAGQSQEGDWRIREMPRHSNRSQLLLYRVALERRTPGHPVI